MNATVALRPTDDIDVIVGARTFTEWRELVRLWERRGFRAAPDGPICRYVKDELIVDVMPLDTAALGFGNRWYADAAALRLPATGAPLSVVRPIHFVATKLDAFESRGNGDPVTSHDLEDIFVVLRGLPALVDEIAAGTDAVHVEVRRQLGALCARADALDVIRALLEGDEPTQALAPGLLSRLRAACAR